MRIALENHEFEGHNNAYLLSDGEEVGLVDAGIATPAVREQLAASLDEHGHSFADVDRLVVTHWHADHSGLAGEIQAAGDATVYAHEADAPLVARDPEANEAMGDTLSVRYDEWGMPDEDRAELEAFLAAGQEVAGDPVDVTPVEDGDTLRVGGTDLEVIHTPGHTAGLVCLTYERGGRREVLTGDAILPEYTPNVGGADVRVDRPLERYVTTLDRLAGAGFDRALPGHRDPIDDPTARAREIRDHHEQRARRVLETLLEVGPADPWTVGAELFGDLSGIHIMHGPGESFAHLDHLRRGGLVERDSSAYRVADRVAEDGIPERSLLDLDPAGA